MTADELDARADALYEQAAPLVTAATAAAHAAGRLDPRNSLMSCAEAAPLHAEAANLRRQARTLRGEQPRATAAPFPKAMTTPIQTNENTPTMTNTDLDAAVATAVAAALAGMPPLAQTDPKAAAEELRKLEGDAVAARIVGGDCTAAQITAQRHASEIRAAEREEEEDAAVADASDAATLAARIAAA